MIKKIQELRAKTFMSMALCKKALEQANGEVDQAIEILKKMGLKKVDNQILPLEGKVFAKAFPGASIVVEVNCQTDFGAKSEIFSDFVNSISAQYLRTLPRKIAYYPDVTLVSNQLGEKVVVRRHALRCDRKENEVNAVYNHQNGKIAVSVKAEVEKSTPEIETMLQNVAMHIAANKPLALDRESVPLDLIDKQKALFAEEIGNKPEAIREKILNGKLEKWFSEVVLLDQEAIFEKKKISEVLGDVKLIDFVRFERGEEIK